MELQGLTDDLRGATGNAERLLAIEILSRSTRTFDLLLKKDRLARAGWVSEYDAEGIRVYRLPSPDEVQDQAGASAGG